MKKLEIMNKLSTNMSRKVGDVQLWAKKNEPQIWLTVGLISFAGAVVTACRSTLKVNDILDEHQNNMKMINTGLENPELIKEGKSYTVEDAKRDKFTQYVHTSVDLVKLYALPAALSALSIVSILRSNSIMTKRYTAAVTAFNAVSEAFESYRRRVVEEQGELMDRHYRYGTKLETVTEKVTDENGKTHKVEKLQEAEDSVLDVPADGAVIFDENNPNWDRNATFNQLFLHGKQEMMNNILQTRGHLFLNEVYDELGFPHTPFGAIVGWKLGHGDDYVDFGISNLENPSNPTVAEFINGYSNKVVLEFNYDGVILNDLEE